MSNHGFASAFDPELGRYLVFKQSMGCYGASRIWYLRRFDAYCAQHDRRVFDRDTVGGWVTEQLDRSGAYRFWMSYVRDFGGWLPFAISPSLTCLGLGAERYRRM